MAVRWKAVPGLYAVLVDHPKLPESHVRGIEVVAKRKRVVAFQPSLLRQAAFVAAPERDHGSLSSKLLYN
jgi:hypothetical protein